MNKANIKSILEEAIDILQISQSQKEPELSQYLENLQENIFL